MEYKEIVKRMYHQQLYYSDDESLMKEQMTYLDLLYDFNKTRPSELEKRIHLLHKMFAEVGKDCYVEPPLYANWCGKNVNFGRGVYAIVSGTLVADSDMSVGEDVMRGPNVTATTGRHPVQPGLRSNKAQYNVPIHINSNVWIGSNAISLPGVHIGGNTVIGAGSVVTKNIPANVVAVGNPCRVIREINEDDMTYYYRDMQIDID